MTATRTAPPDDSTTPPEHPGHPESTRAFLVRGAVLVLVGLFIGGPIGAVVTAAGVVATWRRPVSLVAGSAAALLVAAGLATVLEVRPEQGALRSTFATARPIAAACGLAAGMLMLVAVVTAAARERSTVPAATSPEVSRGWWRRGSLDPDAARHAAREAAAWIALLVATVVVRLATAPVALPALERQLVENLRNGAGYVVGVPGAYLPTGAPSPVPVLIGAFGPGGAETALLLASLAAVGAAMALAFRLAGRSAALGTGLATLVLQVLTAQRLPSTLASALLLTSALLLLDQRGVNRRVIAAGVALGLAVLCQPWAALAGPLLAGWVALGRDRDHPGSVPSAGAFLLVAVATGAPWQRYLITTFDTWTPSTEMALSLGAVAALAPLALVAASVAATRRLSTTTS